MKPLLKCDFCDFQCEYKSSLDRHRDNRHLKIKSFKCDICDSMFGIKQTLGQHVSAVHRREKPYKCRLCEHATSRKCNLNIHVDVVHLREKIHSCKECDFKTIARCYRPSRPERTQKGQAFQVPILLLRFWLESNFRETLYNLQG